MELFHDVKIDWLGKKWYFLGFSLIFSVSGLLSLFFWHGLPLDIDFRGGTVVRVKFAEKPDLDRIRAAANKAGLHDSRIAQFGPADHNEIEISLSRSQTSEAALDQGRAEIVSTLTNNYSSLGAQNQGKLDLDNVSRGALATWLAQNDPEHMGQTDAAQARYQQQADAVAHFRDDLHSGIVSAVDDLRGTVDPAVLSALEQGAYVSGFHVQGAEVVGAQVGKQLQKQAILATLYSLGGMLVYLWFRFELIYGVAAVVACFHDTLITVGAFSLRNQEISLTVIAAILTLVGYSMNDTIVVFDRIRENLRLSRREKLADLVNRSINQTLSRTVLTSGLTFLTVLSLFIFGGEVLRGFSFALVIGILIGTYSSIAIAAPMLVAWQDWRSGRGRGAASLPAAKKARV